MQTVPLPAQATAFPRARPSADRLTFNGWFLFAIGLSLIGSGFLSGRFKVGGLMVHPFLAVVALVFPLLATMRLSVIPVRMVVSMSLFAIIYFASTFVGGVDIGEGVKIAASIVTAWTVAMLVRNWNDFVAGVLGMGLAIGALAVIGLRTDEVGSLEAIESANRNAYSLYALPCILLIGFVLLRPGGTSMFVRFALIGVLLALSLGIALNLNRSGWLGLALILVLLMYEKSFKAAIVAGIVGTVLGVIVSTLFHTAHIQERIAATKSGLSSDDLRWRLIQWSFDIGIENPLLGISPQGLSMELASRMGYPGGSIATHNMLAHLVGGSGLICVGIMFYCGYLLWRWGPTGAVRPGWMSGFQEARRVVRYLLILWLFRGMFSHEILYAPAFWMALGLTMGLCISRFPPPAPRRIEHRRYSSLNHGETVLG